MFACFRGHGASPRCPENAPEFWEGSGIGTKRVTVTPRVETFIAYTPNFFNYYIHIYESGRLV